MTLARVADSALPAPATRVLHVYAGNLYGGIEAFLRTMASQAARAPAASMAFALCFEGRLARELRASGATVHMLGAVRARSRRSVQAARDTLARTIAECGYQVVVCHSAWPHVMFAGIARQLGVRLVHHMHDVPNRWGWLDRLASRTPPDLVVCNSSFTAASGEWLFPGVRRKTILCPVELGGPLGPGERKRLRLSLGAKESDVVIVQASRMQAWKGHPLLIDALAKLRSNPRWTCWIAGGVQRPSEVAYQDGLRASIARQGLEDRVRFIGQRSDMSAVLRAADLYCQPNTGPEPFGIAFIEALAAGLPLVTTAMGAPLEIVDSSCGVLVAPGDARALSVALADLIDGDERRKDMSTNGPDRARELCDPAARTRDLAAEFSSLVAAPEAIDVHARASLSKGMSDEAIHFAIAAALRARGSHYGSIVDLGCGRGDCGRSLQDLYGTYLGCDVVRYDDFPRSSSARFLEVDLNRTPFPLADALAEVVLSVETIEHVENPRALVREMARIVRPGGWIVVTTPNQISLASKIHLVVKDQFLAFQAAPGLYPAHITALVPEDLRRIAQECGLTDIEIRYTDRGRIPLSARHWPARLGLRGAWFSDNVIVLAKRALV
jgi:glycosyltransferase involved in cell wall biosynthesis/2-polyprenyl-3-methyl-5-hydroxy-6-metoxy-1,4-benzoquinol methylase